MTRTENRLVQAAQHAAALGVLGHGAQQETRKRFIGAMKSSERARVITEARIIYAEILTNQGFNRGQVGATIGRSKQAISYYLGVFSALKASDPAFRDKAVRARREFDALMSL